MILCFSADLKIHTYFFMAVAWSYKQMGYTFGQAMLCLRKLVTGFSPWRLGFDSRGAHLGFVLDEVQMGQVFLCIIQFIIVSIIPPVLHTNISFM